MDIRVISPSQIPRDWYGSLIGFDIETEDKVITAPICMVSIYKPSAHQIYVIPFHVYDHGVEKNISSEELEVFKNFYSTTTIVGANLQFDISRILYHWGVRPKAIYLDTYIVARVLQLEKQGLKDMAVRVNPKLSDVVRHFENVVGDKPPFYYEISDSRVVKYSGLDAYLPFVVISGMKKQIQANARTLNIEMGFLNIAADQNYNGLRFDLDKYGKIFKEFSEKVELKNKELDELAGFHVRPNATADIKKLFVDGYQCVSDITTKKGAVSTSVQSLEHMRDVETRENVIDLLNRVIELKSMFSVVNSSKKVPNYVIGDRLHFELDQIGYDGTARVYSHDTSVNQLTKEMREAVIPSDGKKFFYMDYKAAELYIAMYWSRCKRGLEWYNSGKDLHTEVMRVLLGKDEVTKEDRAVSKVLSFSQIYGGSERTIARDLHCSVDYALQLANDYKKLFPEIVDLREAVVAEAHQNGYTKTIFGRVRKLQNINSNDNVAMEKDERRAFNTAVQSSCADFLKIAAYRCFKEFYSQGVRCAFTVFDSFLLEVPENFTEEQCLKIAERLSDFTEYFPNFKLRYDYAIGHNWKECQDKC